MLAAAPGPRSGRAARPACRQPGSPRPCRRDAELLQITLGEYLRRPEKLLRQNLRMIRELAAASGSGGLRALTDLGRAAAARPPRRSHASTVCAAATGKEVDHPPSLPPTPAPRTPFNRPITAHRRLSFTTIPLDDRQGGPPGVRLHVQRRGDGFVRGHAAALPHEARRAARRAADRHGAGEHPRRRRGRHLPEPGVRLCWPAWPRTRPIPSSGFASSRSR